MIVLITAKTDNGRRALQDILDAKKKNPVLMRTMNIHAFFRVDENSIECRDRHFAALSMKNHMHLAAITALTAGFDSFMMQVGCQKDDYGVKFV